MRSNTQGYLNVPEDGVYTFHAPRELVYPDMDAGYELKLEVGERAYTNVPRKAYYGLQEWYPSTRLHAMGNWSVAFKKGAQPFRFDVHRLPHRRCPKTEPPRK